MVDAELQVVGNEEEVTEDVVVGLTLEELTEKITELETQLNEERLNFSTKKYPLVFGKMDIPQEKYGNYNDIQAFINSVYNFIQKDLVWKGEEFLMIEGLFKEVSQLKNDYKKSKGGELVMLSAMSIETFLRLSLGTTGKGVAEAHKRIYILKPFHNAQSFITEAYDSLERKSKQLTDLYVQRHQLENNINPYEPTEIPEEVEQQLNS
jgi:hypothetical protein